jgi:CheY-like chemotaxis protein
MVRSGMARVLVVDDEEATRKLLKRVIEAHGHTCVTAGNGDEALCHIYRSDEYFDVVVLDLNMPGGIGGIEFLKLKFVSDRLRDAAIIVVSGIASDVPREQLRGAAVIFDKPIMLDQLMRTINGSTRDTIPPGDDPDPDPEPAR